MIAWMREMQKQLPEQLPEQSLAWGCIFYVHAGVCGE